jgi:hypothetical protein
VKKIAAVALLTLLIGFKAGSINAAHGPANEDLLKPQLILQDGTVPPTCSPLTQTCPKGL